MANKVLSIAIGNEFTKVCELSFNKYSLHKQVQIHNSISFRNPDNTINDGYIIDPKRFGEELKKQLNAGGMKSDKAIFSISSGKIASREVNLPPVSSKKIMGIIKTGVSDLFPIDIKDYILSYTVIENTNTARLTMENTKEKLKKIKTKLSSKDKKSNAELIAEKFEHMDANAADMPERMTGEIATKKEDNLAKRQVRVCVYAVPSSLVKNYFSFAKSMHLDIVSLDYSGNSSYQILKRQGNKGTNVYVQLNGKDTLVSIFKDNNLIFQRTIGYGISMLADVLLEQGFDEIKTRDEALRLLESSNLLKYARTRENSYGMPAMDELTENNGSMMDEAVLAYASMKEDETAKEIIVDGIEEADHKAAFAQIKDELSLNAAILDEHAAYASIFDEFTTTNEENFKEKATDKMKSGAGGDSLDKPNSIRAGQALAEAMGYLTGSVARILDYYRSNHENEQIGMIYLAGPGLMVQGIDDYFNSALGLQCEKMLELVGVKKAAQANNIHSGEYISCIGAVLKPVDLVPKEFIEKRQWRSAVFTTLVFSLTCMFASACVIYVGFFDYLIAKKNLAEVTKQLNELPEIESVYEKYDLAFKELEGLEDFEEELSGNNDLINEIILELENRLPTGARISTIQFTKNGVNFSVTVPINNAGVYVVMAKLYSELQEIPYFETVEISNDVSIDETSVLHTASYHISCSYVQE